MNKLINALIVLLGSLFVMGSAIAFAVQSKTDTNSTSLQGLDNPELAISQAEDWQKVPNLNSSVSTTILDNTASGAMYALTITVTPSDTGSELYDCNAVVKNTGVWRGNVNLGLLAGNCHDDTIADWESIYIC